jgi:hypothetical protein
MFGSPKAFLNAMQGRGSVGQVLAAIGVLPATFRSESEALKTIATESKVFSIVATGYVRQGKRETRVRVHSVVDFRGAPAPAEALVEAVTALTGGGGAASSGSEDKSGKGQSGLPEGVTEEGIAGAFRADPAGKVLYYRIN